MFISLVCVQEVAELTEEDLFSDTTEDLSSDTATGSCILSGSHSTHTHARKHTHTHMYTRLVLLYTDIADLFKVKMTLKNVINWMDLGLALGVLYPTLQKIDSEKHGKVDDCMREMLAAWLKQQDDVDTPSWSVLKTALRNIGENKIANTIPP